MQTETGVLDETIHKDLTGRAALVTGAARGIGRSIARRLAARGASVVISDLLADAAGTTAEEFKSAGFTALALAGDVSSAGSVEETVAKTVEAFGSLDILVNNAGITKDGLLFRMNETDWDKVMAVNLKGVFLVTKAASRVMAQKRWGRIVNISSVVGLMGNAGQANYAASKAGVVGFTKACAKELAGRNITVNAVAPGYIQTEMTEKLPERAKEAFLAAIPLGRAGTAEEVAAAVGFLVSEEAGYITGQVLQIDGGLLM
ncbi:MAG TPA: 3-oxoacyl-[acyl-carrier-protein] reductase [Verrucomicrobiae bacterium]|nr:3-oxoacyl-[acyl-carrier-protein] reductase [Verrucomicrobiae bacterium]